MLPETDGGAHEPLQVADNEPPTTSPAVGTPPQNSEAGQDSPLEAPLPTEETLDVLPAGVIAALQRQARYVRI